MPDIAATSPINVSFDDPTRSDTPSGAEPTPGAPGGSGWDVKLSAVSELTIVTLNLHGGQRTRRISTPRLRHRGPPPEKASSNGAFDVAGVLRSFDADVLVVQEAWWPDEGGAAVDVAAAECGATVHSASFGRGIVEPWPHIISARPHRACGRIGVAVVSRPPARLVEMIPVGDVPGDPALRRCALRVALDVGGDKLDLIAVHLTSRLPYGPPMQIRNLRRRLPAPEERTVIVGDLNLWGPAVTAMLPGWRRAVRGRTWPAHRPHSQIDHVLVRDDVEVIDGAVLDEVGPDHRPLRATLRLP
jgi:endonuclease/exonuclease/phosphatase family metal-dependent hydrolase